MTAPLIIVSGILFLFEGGTGMFNPRLYRHVESASKGVRSPVVSGAGAALGLWGVVCILASIPPRELGRWYLIVFGAACAYKGFLMVFRPGSLRNTPTLIREHPTRWRLTCGVRALVGAALIVWGRAEWISA